MVGLSAVIRWHWLEIERLKTFLSNPPLQRSKSLSTEKSLDEKEVFLKWIVNRLCLVLASKIGS